MSKQKDAIAWAKIDSFNGNHTSPALTYYRPCPICGSLKSKAVLELSDFQFYSDSADQPKRVDVRENICLDCFALYLNPCYSNYGFRVLFAEAGQSYGSTEGRPQEQIDWLSVRGLLNDDSSLLDVGCYDGSFLSRLPDHVRKLGVDIDEPAITSGLLKHGEKEIQFFHGDFETFQFRGPAPTTITMLHVLEHLPRPVEVLKKLRSIAGPDTRLVVEVPILENGKTNDINGFFSVQHMTHFSRSSLKACLSLGGWKIEEKHEKADYNGCRILASVMSEASLYIPCAPAQQDWTLLADYLSGWYVAIGSAQQRIQNMPFSTHIVIWGGGAHTEFLYQVTTAFHANRNTNLIIVDSDSSKHGRTWRGIPIYSPSIIKDVDWSSAVLLVSSYGGQGSIVSAAEKLNVPPERIVQIYEAVRRY